MSDEKLKFLPSGKMARKIKRRTIKKLVKAILLKTGVFLARLKYVEDSAHDTPESRAIISPISCG